jgi:hypothetical protein
MIGSLRRDVVGCGVTRPEQKERDSFERYGATSLKQAWQSARMRTRKISMAHPPSNASHGRRSDVFKRKSSSDLRQSLDASNY